MSLNTVIIAIIVLIVLVVLVMIFTGYFGKIFTPTVASCEGGGGTCTAASTGCGNDELNRPIGQLKGYKCLSSDSKPDTTKVCCQRTTTGATAFG